MNARKISSFKKLLNEQLKTLIQEAQKTVSGMTDSKENFPDPTDRRYAGIRSQFHVAHPGTGDENLF